MYNGNPVDLNNIEDVSYIEILVSSIAESRMRIKALKKESEFIDSGQKKESEDMNKQVKTERSNMINSDSFKEFKICYAEMIRSLLHINEHKNTRKAVFTFFNNQQVKFKLTEATTFDELKSLVGNTFGLPKEKIFFTMDPEEEFPPILIGKESVIKQVYAWKNFMIRKTSPVIYVILSDYQTIEEMQDELVPRVKTQNSSFSSEPELHPEVVKEKNKSAAEAVTARVRKNKIINFMEAVMLLGIFIMWVLSITDEVNVAETSWMNLSIQNRLYGNPFESDHAKIYPESGSEFFLIKNVIDFWNYYTISRSRFYTERYPIKLNSYIYLYEALQFRQVRSNKHICEIEGYGNTVCLKRYSLDKNTDDYSAKSRGFLYDSEGISESSVGRIDIYDFGGFKIDMPLQSLNVWEVTMLSLISEKWIDCQTRAIFVSYNMVNPSLGQLSTVMDIIEIGPHGEFALGYTISTINYAHVNFSFIAFHAVIFIWVLSLILIQIRKNLIGRNEKIFVENRKIESLKNSLSEEQFEKRMKKILRDWKKHDNIACWKRLRKPESDEIMTFGTVIVLLVLEFADSFYYVHEMSTITVNEDAYTNLYPTVRDLKMFIDLKLIALVFLSGIICMSFRQWMENLKEMYEAGLAYFNELAFFIAICYVFVIVYSITVYYIAGPYMQSASTLDYVLFWSMSLATGSASIDKSVSVFLPVLYVFFFCVIYRIVFFFILMIGASHFYLKLETSRLGGTLRNITDDK